MSPALDDAYEAWRLALDAFRADPSYETGAAIEEAATAIAAAEQDSLTRGFARRFDHTH